MSNNSDYMYYKLKEELIESLQSDEFYDVFNRSIRSGKTNFSHYQKLINNVIDPTWVNQIEECIIPIDNIIRRPMGFIKEEQEVVPIEQTKKVSQEAIRHLAQHTNMISKVHSDGSVTPNKLLNVYKEETFATYENRFIYTLLKHLQYFIDKRLKLINDSKIQTENKIRIESDFTIGKEKLKYKFSLSSIERIEKAKKGFKIDEDTSQMNLLQRVERLRMILYDFQNSQLIKSLEGCLLVKPPIMRTNVILKNPNFKKALELWLFIESYNDAGLSVQVFETEEMPNDTYIEEMFNIALFNYHLFNFHVKPEKQLELNKPLQKEFKPTLVRRTVEEYVKDLTMDVDEIEKVFIDQIKRATKKRKDFDEKVKKAIERALEKEKEMKKRQAELERKRKEEAKLLAKQQIAEERIKLKNNIKNNVISIIDLIQEKYPHLGLDVNKNKTALVVNNSKENILVATFNDKEGIYRFRATKQFYDYMDTKHPGLLNKETIDSQDDWYDVIDKGLLTSKEVNAIVNHSIKYISQLDAKKKVKPKAKKATTKKKPTTKKKVAPKKKATPKKKPVAKSTFTKKKIDKHIQDIKDFVMSNYDDTQVVYSKDNTLKAYRKKKPIATVTWNDTSYKMTLQKKQTAIKKLMEKYPKLVTKSSKDDQWYKITNKGDLTSKSVLSLVGASYEYSVLEEEKIKAQKAKEKEKAKAAMKKAKEKEKQQTVNKK